MRATHTSETVRTPLTAGPAATANRRSLGWLAAGLGAAAAAAGGLVAPTDAVQGQIQRLMYLHVPAAWVGMLAFGVVLAASVGYLATRDLRWDRCGRAAAEVGVGATVLALLVGAGWGRAVWGTWWAWDPRLVSTALLVLAYTGYLALRGAVGADDGGHPAARRAAAVGIVAFGLVPVVHYSVVWWRSLHQQATILGPTRPPIEPVMGASLVLAALACTGLAGWLFLHRLSRLETVALVDGPGPVPVPVPAPVAPPEQPVPVGRR
ncbi:cytochrome c biogenesis protein CcsA [Micromonospora zhanjiangensis]|uniref:Heme exporter protein C n=1 Tax=Micromonospora zhanjiangensis TaxID=1522057 RepID=A0ABV8KPG3_9ACTN